MEPIFVPTPEAVLRSQMTAFTRYCEQRLGRPLESPAALQAFAVAEFRTFWSLFLGWSGLLTSGSPEPVCVGDACETAVFFPGLSVSYTENLLRSRQGLEGSRPALSACNERGETVRLTRAELTARVLAVAERLRELGLRPGDRVAAVASNTADTVVACLASVALGATWSSVAPDLGAPAILARFAPLEPRVLFFHSTVLEGGERRPVGERIEAVLEGLPSLRAAFALRDDPLPRRGRDLPLAPLAELWARPPSGLARLSDLPRLPWNHPLFILFSSGTTGRPKCLVHGAGGTLLEHHKEHRLHSDLGPEDKLYFHTTCSWMMWNWLLSALACGTELVLYEGAISHPEPDALWRLVARERVTVFGTSPAYLQYSRTADFRPGERLDLSALRALQSTGSVLRDPLFEWVRDRVKPVPVQSISGGTDILGCFLLGNPNLPVYPGELQSPSLGLDVRALGDASGKLGELICAGPFPSRPLGLYGDPGGERFHETYFAQHPGVWTHGDLLEWTPRGTARLHGRTDGVLNVRGVRVGPAELYAALEGVAELAECMAIEQRAPAEPGGSRLVLLVVLHPGLQLTPELSLRLRRVLAERCSPAHVPAVIAQVAELPQTHNGKRAERAARDAANGDPVANLEALRNPACLEAIRAHPALALGPAPAPAPLRAPGAPLPSRAELERLLLTLWKAELGLAQVGPTDDFYELGGQSLVAVALLLRVQAALGRRLPLSTFKGAGATVAGMAEELLRPPPPEDFTPLALQPQGERLPLVWLAGSVGGLALSEVARRLGGGHPVLALEPRLRPGAPRRSLRAWARSAARELQAARPGPYALAGLAEGGYLAFEVGRQLVAEGERVELLALVDTPAPLSPDSWHRLAELTQRGREALRRLRASPRAELAPLGRRLLARGASPRAPEPWGPEVEEYRREPVVAFPGRLTVLLSEGRPAGESPWLDARLAWHRLAQGGLDVRAVAGPHRALLTGEGAARLAAALRACLEAVPRAGEPAPQGATAA